jgi:hypothetical protein
MKAKLEEVENEAELPPTSGTETLRPIGLSAGEFVVPDNFDDPLPDELLGAFEGE